MSLRHPVAVLEHSCRYPVLFLPSFLNSVKYALSRFFWVFGKGGGLDDITSYHHWRVKELFPDIVILLLSSFNREGNSVAASSSSFKMARCIPLISSRNVSMEVREVKVSSVHVFSLHCSITSSICLTVLYMVSFTFRSPRGVPWVPQTSNRLSQALVVSTILSRKKTLQPNSPPY